VSEIELTAEDVTSFLVERHGGPVEDLEPLGGGWWSSAWAYRTGPDRLVVRFGHHESWYHADRMAMAFARPGLPVPEVREVGQTGQGLAYAISVRHYGSFLEDTPAEQAPALGATLSSLLLALLAAPAPPGTAVSWHSPSTSPPTWRAFVLAALIDDPADVAHGWGAALAENPTVSPIADAAAARIRTYVEACPERRDLVHSDLLHGNVLVGQEAKAVEAVYSWKCSVRGDFLYDAAWCTFWSPWHEGVAAADPLGHLLAAPALRSDPGALVDAAIRHHCYELQIGYSHLGWNIWTGNERELGATARRLDEILERGPLRLPS
jgi:aminoglycoside phosphotransferase (APT) family kinase protein